MSSAWAVIEDQGELLFVRRAFDVGRGGQWCPPGGTMWRDEWPEVACVREAFEETGLRVSVVRPIAKFDGAHFVHCTLNSPRSRLRLREEECIDARWVRPEDILSLGTVMDLRRVIPVLKLAGFKTPPLPVGLIPSVPTEQFV